MRLSKTSPARRPNLGVRLVPLLLALGSPLAAAPSSDPAPSPSRWDLPAPNMSRRGALLGGASRMEQILAQQGVAVISNAVMIGSPPTPAGGDAHVSSRLALAHGGVSAPAGPAERASPGAPNVFGSQALRVSRTPLEYQWLRASAQSAGLRQWSADLPGVRTGHERETLDRVNRWVNDRVQFVDDFRRSGQADSWSGATETLRRGSGDCEDFALAKMQLLSALGFADEQMYLVIVRDLVRQSDHAVLVVEAGDRFLVLDNMTDEILESGQVRDYRPIFSYSGQGRWIHGYARQRALPPVQLASTAFASLR
ncbi:MAG TPA: transglutaminase-like cysteine peptidase [Allosphingosinicella sp.]|nr:transglutaminase-like cysteine peptidase [Allosphingosinicella sp.]